VNILEDGVLPATDTTVASGSAPEVIAALAEAVTPVVAAGDELELQRLL